MGGQFFSQNDVILGDLENDEVNGGVNFNLGLKYKLLPFMYFDLNFDLIALKSGTFINFSEGETFDNKAATSVNFGVGFQI